MIYAIQPLIDLFAGLFALIVCLVFWRALLLH